MKPNVSAWLRRFDDSPEPAAEQSAPELTPGDAPQSADETDFLTPATECMRLLTETLEAENRSLKEGTLERIPLLAAEKLERLHELESVFTSYTDIAQPLQHAEKQRLIDVQGMLHKAAEENLALLSAVGSAVNSVSDIVIRTMEKAQSEGTYSRDGKTDRPGRLSATGFTAEL